MFLCLVFPGVNRKQQQQARQQQQQQRRICPSKIFQSNIHFKKIMNVKEEKSVLVSFTHKLRVQTT